jgi:hypothetical protein
MQIHVVSRRGRPIWAGLAIDRADALDRARRDTGRLLRTATAQATEWASGDHCWDEIAAIALALAGWSGALVRSTDASALYTSLDAPLGDVGGRAHVVLDAAEGVICEPLAPRRGRRAPRLGAAAWAVAERLAAGRAVAVVPLAVLVVQADCTVRIVPVVPEIGVGGARAAVTSAQYCYGPRRPAGRKKG